jgi:recombination associated protein RdgC
MFKNALLYRITQWDASALDSVEERLAAGRFTECGATQPESAGWVQPRGDKHDALMESVGGQLILRLCVERKAVPSSAVKAKLDERLDKIEQETGRRPKGKQAKELKEEILQDLLPRAFPKRSANLVWIAPKLGWVVINAGSMKSADRIVTRLVETLGGGIVVRPINTQTSPSVAMAEWLKSKEAPAGFTIDRECELKQPDSEKSTVRYARHTLDIDEVGEHIDQGKMPTQLALTWASRVSFVLTEGLAIKKIKLLDVVMEGNASATGKDDGGFDADVAISTGELSQLIPELIDALGGELPEGQLAAGPAAAPAAKDEAPVVEAEAA